MSTVTVLTYCVAGVAKLAGPLGRSWTSGEALRSQIAVDALRKDLLGDGSSPLVSKLYDQTWLFRIAGLGSLVIETGAPLFLADKRLGRLWAANAFFMHWGIFFVMKIKFRYQMTGLIFASFFDLDRVIDNVFERLRGMILKSSSLEDISTLDAFPGSGSFVFDRGAVAGKKPVPVHYHVPDDLTENSPVVFVMHGTKRDAEHYRDDWRAAAERFGFLLLCPEFRRDLYNRRAYHLGYVTHRSRKPRIRERWTFNAIEALFDFIKMKTGNVAERYHIYGHSAGAQFVHRMTMFMPDARFHTAVAANSGWYTIPDFGTEYPYGLGDAPITPETLRRAFARELVILLGERDTDPEDPYLRTSPEVAVQGMNRLQRGLNFHAAAGKEAARVGADFQWRLRTVPHAQHLDPEMMPFAMREIFGK